MPHAHEDSHTSPVMINNLPDDIFLEIFREVFALYLFETCPYPRYWYPGAITLATSWQRLVHVCQRWRNIIYGSPQYLGLHLHCSSETPFRKISGRWPEFPLTLNYTIYQDDDNDDIVFALEHPDRVRRVDLSTTHSGSVVQEVLRVMQVPFPALTHLDLTGPDPENNPEELELPDRFLGGSAPRLQHIHLDVISFPALPELLSSARGLVCLELRNTPANGHGYISPEAMIGGLAGLISLRTLCIYFSMPSVENLQERRRPGLSIRASLPSLTRFEFTGESEYLEALLAQIDAPRVEVIEIVYLTPEVRTRQFSQFIGRTAIIGSAQFRHAQVKFEPEYAQIDLERSQGECHQAYLTLAVRIEGDYHHLSRFLGQLADMLCDVDHLLVEMGRYWTENGDRTETCEWLAFLRLFPAVEVLRAFGGLAMNIASTLENIAEETVAEVLPALRLLHLGNGDEPVASTERFLALRVLSGRPVTVLNMQDKSDG